MSLTFSTVLDELVTEVVNAPGFDGFGDLVAIRDLKGIVRLAVFEPVAPKADFASCLTELEEKLEGQLGKWFQRPILSNSGTDPILAKIAEKLKGEARPWKPRNIVTGNDAAGNWFLLERRLSKDAWASSDKTEPPWPLMGTNPPIIAFYSFKGGVGRSTALAAVASILAKDKRVAVIDLDLEAPGLGPFFDVSPKRGVIDILIDHGVTGKIDLDDASADCDSVTIFPAGSSLTADYLEKLGRLDFGRAGFDLTQPPVATALKALLKSLKRQFDYIFLDARAGLHDLGGLALQGLAHVDVVVARPSQQTTEGLRLALGHLREVRGENMQVVVAHGQAPNDHHSTEANDFAETAYRLFCEVVYDSKDDLPSQEDTSKMHTVVRIPQHPSLTYMRNINDAKEVFGQGVFDPLVERVKERIVLANGETSARIKDEAEESSE